MEEENRRSLGNEDDETMALIRKETPKKGGFRTMPFIILSEALHSLANTGLNANMVIYLTKEFLMEAVAASSIISLWSAASSFLSVGGAVLSDSLLGRFTVIIIGSCFTLLVLVPILSKITGNPRGLSTNVRLGAGMVLSISAMTISGAVESTRRWNAYKQNSVEMSVLWLVPSLLLLGMSQTLNSMEQLAFYYSQLPKAMSSIAVCIFTLVAAIGSLLSSVLIDAVDRFTSGGGKLNEGHLDYYYWLIAGICSANFVYFLLFCRTSN
ncbi:Protein NRT1/ PTR FAMILY 1.2 [Linum perenne]